MGRSSKKKSVNAVRNSEALVIKAIDSYFQKIYMGGGGGDIDSVMGDPTDYNYTSEIPVGTPVAPPKPATPKSVSTEKTDIGPVATSVNPDSYSSEYYLDTIDPSSTDFPGMGGDPTLNAGVTPQTPKNLTPTETYTPTSVPPTYSMGEQFDPVTGDYVGDQYSTLADLAPGSNVAPSSPVTPEPEPEPEPDPPVSQPPTYSGSESSYWYDPTDPMYDDVMAGGSYDGPMAMDPGSGDATQYGVTQSGYDQYIADQEAAGTAIIFPGDTVGSDSNDFTTATGSPAQTDTGAPPTSSSGTAGLDEMGMLTGGIPTPGGDEVNTNEFLGDAVPSGPPVTQQDYSNYIDTQQQIVFPGAGQNTHEVNSTTSNLQTGEPSDAALAAAAPAATPADIETQANAATPSTTAATPAPLVGEGPLLSGQSYATDASQASETQVNEVIPSAAAAAPSDSELQVGFHRVSTDVCKLCPTSARCNGNHESDSIKELTGYLARYE